jgi:hypothetical protein
MRELAVGFQLPLAAGQMSRYIRKRRWVERREQAQRVSLANGPPTPGFGEVSP